MDWDNSGAMGCGENRGQYGLGPYDAQAAFALEGFPFNVIAAPFKAGFKVAKFGVKTAIKVAPAAAIGFLTAGPVGMATGIGTRLLRGSGGNVSQATAQLPTTGTGSPGFWAGPNATYSQAPQVQGAGTPRADTSVSSVLNLLRDELLAAGGRAVAQTPQGREAIQQQVTGDIGRYMLPLAIGGGALLLIIAMKR